VCTGNPCFYLLCTAQCRLAAAAAVDTLFLMYKQKEKMFNCLTFVSNMGEKAPSPPPPPLSRRAAMLACPFIDHQATEGTDGSCENSEDDAHETDMSYVSPTSNHSNASRNLYLASLGSQAEELGFGSPLNGHRPKFESSFDPRCRMKAHPGYAGIACPLPIPYNYLLLTPTCPGTMCPEGHKCPPHTFKRQRWCDECVVEIAAGSEGKRCNICEYDLCSLCARATPISHVLSTPPGLSNPLPRPNIVHAAPLAAPEAHVEPSHEDSDPFQRARNRVKLNAAPEAHVETSHEDSDPFQRARNRMKLKRLATDPALALDPAPALAAAPATASAADAEPAPAPPTAPAPDLVSPAPAPGSDPVLSPAPEEYIFISSQSSTACEVDQTSAGHSRTKKPEEVPNPPVKVAPVKAKGTPQMQCAPMVGVGEIPARSPSAPAQKSSKVAPAPVSTPPLTPAVIASNTAHASLAQMLYSAGVVPLREHMGLAQKLIDESFIHERVARKCQYEDPDFFGEMLTSIGMKTGQQSCLTRYLDRPLVSASGTTASSATVGSVGGTEAPSKNPEVISMLCLKSLCDTAGVMPPADHETIARRLIDHGVADDISLRASLLWSPPAFDLKSAVVKKGQYFTIMDYLDKTLVYQTIDKTS
jgi:hypothetical protein